MFVCLQQEERLLFVEKSDSAVLQPHAVADAAMLKELQARLRYRQRELSVEPAARIARLLDPRVWQVLPELPDQGPERWAGGDFRARVCDGFQVLHDDAGASAPHSVGRG